MSVPALKAFDDLVADFQKRRFEPLYLLHGEETFFGDRLQQLLIERALLPHERDFNLDVFFGPEADARQVLAACASFPMMAERRVVIVRSFDGLADNRLFKDYAEQPNPTAVVLLVCSGKVNMATHPYRALKEKARAVEFKPLTERQMPAWIERVALERGLSITPQATQLLAYEVGGELRVAAGELDKLHAYAGDRSQLDESDVLAVAGHQHEFSIFELQSALAGGDGRRAMTIASAMMERATNRPGEALRIVAMLTRYLRGLRGLAAIQSRRPSDAEVSRHIGVRPFAVKDYRSGLRTYGVSGVARAAQALLAADYELKGGSNRDPGLVVQLLMRRWAGAS